MTYGTVTQDTCTHDTKVKMVGLKNKFECTNCGKFIPIVELKETDHTPTKYLENNWKDDWN